MEDIEVAFDATVYSVEDVLRATHRFTDRCVTHISTSPDKIHVRLAPVAGIPLEPTTAGLLTNAVVDERLRASIRRETGELHATLVKAALTGARPRSAP